ncbi:MAG: glutamate--tRNA ligase family protein, partial [Paracoccus sp. (in: a-proteobacteria)]|nr:glutamate--tRNA ligase family protein [Paracoccus sp. (in: a-proteobacteria)]
LGAEGLEFHDGGAPSPGHHRLDRSGFLAGIGDIVLSRRGMGTSYHLSVVVDDAAQGITLVTRGADLFEATWIHVLLQGLLKLPQPGYYHHRLIRDESGRRLAKRDDARSLRELRAQGAGPDDIRRLLMLP